MSPALCPTHDVALIPTKSGMQFCCPLNDCDFYTKDSNMSPVKPPAVTSKNRTAEIAAAMAKKASAKPAPTPAPAKAKPVVIPAPKKKAPPAPPEVEQEVQEAADAETDAKVVPAKKEKDPNELTVSDVAKEVGIEPKVARQRLRKDGTRAVDGRWPTVTRGSKEHAALKAKLKGDDDAKPAPAAADAKPAPKKKAPAKVEPEEEEADEPDTAFEGDEEEE